MGADSDLLFLRSGAGICQGALPSLWLFLSGP